MYLRSIYHRAAIPFYCFLDKRFVQRNEYEPGRLFYTVNVHDDSFNTYPLPITTVFQQT